MSYCRFSSDNFKSDVYAWEDCAGGYRVEVAANRIVGEIPTWPDFREPKEVFIEKMRRHTDFIKTCKHEKIGLPHDGSSWSASSPKELLDIFLMLRSEGYHVPQYAIDTAREESLELAKQILKGDGSAK